MSDDKVVIAGLELPYGLTVEQMEQAANSLEMAYERDERADFDVHIRAIMAIRQLLQEKADMAEALSLLMKTPCEYRDFSNDATCCGYCHADIDQNSHHDECALAIAQGLLMGVDVRQDDDIKIGDTVRFVGIYEGDESRRYPLTGTVTDIRDGQAFVYCIGQRWPFTIALNDPEKRGYYPRTAYPASGLYLGGKSTEELLDSFERARVTYHIARRDLETGVGYTTEDDMRKAEDVCVAARRALLSRIEELETSTRQWAEHLADEIVAARSGRTNEDAG